MALIPKFKAMQYNANTTYQSNNSTHAGYRNDPEDDDDDSSTDPITDLCDDPFQTGFNILGIP